MYARLIAKLSGERGERANLQLKCYKPLPTGGGERMGSGVGSAVQDVSDANGARHWRRPAVRLLRKLERARDAANAD